MTASRTDAIVSASLPKMFSYAQNREDAMLCRALRDVTNGTYVDVGAWHPSLHSVTRWFYDHGWSGLNIEPSRKFHALLKRRRPRDVNLNVAVGSESGSQQFFEVGYTGLSSLKAKSVELGRSLGYRRSRAYTVRTLTLSQAIDEHLPGRAINFLKIDVEGLEREVLHGLDLERHRPWILVVEGVHPGTSDAAWADWEPYVLNHRYQLVWFDGLNRFYLREESSALRIHFDRPINVFDDVKVPRIQNAISRIELGLRGLLG